MWTGHSMVIRSFLCGRGGHRVCHTPMVVRWSSNLLVIGVVIKRNPCHRVVKPPFWASRDNSRQNCDQPLTVFEHWSQVGQLPYDHPYDQFFFCGDTSLYLIKYIHHHHNQKTTALIFYRSLLYMTKFEPSVTHQVTYKAVASPLREQFTWAGYIIFFYATVTNHN